MGELNCFFVTDMHGSLERYGKLFERIKEERPGAVFIGGDLLPSPFTVLTNAKLNHRNFINDYLRKEFDRIKSAMGETYPTIFVILGNDDGRIEEESMLEANRQGLWEYCHCRPLKWNGFSVYGYTYVPPTPFRLKDWERFDVSRYVDPGCIAPEDGIFTVQVSEHHLKFATIAEDLEQLTAGADFARSIFLFHSPPYKCNLDRAALDGKMIDHTPLDVHVGSIAIQRFIEEKQPLLTLHGHIHESTRLTGSWRETFGRTESFNAAHDGPELSLIRFDPYCPEEASRELL
jgi:Icc-related predicted phosphoesterase